MIEGKVLFEIGRSSVFRFINVLMLAVQQVSCCYVFVGGSVLGAEVECDYQASFL